MILHFCAHCGVLLDESEQSCTGSAEMRCGNCDNQVNGSNNHIEGEFSNNEGRRLLKLYSRDPGV